MPLQLKGGFIAPKKIHVRSISHIPTQKLGMLVDVDASAQEDGSVIMWDAASSTYKIKPDVENPNLSIIGGTF
jgi:hypothetical protein